MSANLLKLVMLLSFCGGPLFVADELKPLFGRNYAFVLAFGSLVPIIFGFFAFEDNRDLFYGDRRQFALSFEDWTAWDRFVVWLGLAGVCALAYMNLHAFFAILFGAEYENVGLFAVGFLVGGGTCVYYLKLFRDARAAAE